MSLTSALDKIQCPETQENVFVLRYPLLNNSIAMGSKLIVKSNEVAVFVEDGEILDVLEQGVHTISVDTLPALSAKRHWHKKFNGAFRCNIYFVSLVLFENIKWGMVNSLILRDNDFGSIAIKCFGNFAFKLTDARLFFINLFGKIKEFNEDDISLYLKTLIVTGVTEMLLDSRMSALDFVTNYETLEMEDYHHVRAKFANCGLFLQQLNIESVEIPQEIEKLLNYKLQEKMQDVPMIANDKLPVNHPINAGTIRTAEMKKMFNFTHDFTISCVHCGATISKNFKFCPQCGAENKEIAKECPHCHNIVAFKANFCPDCGTKLFDKNNVVLCKHCGRIVKDSDLYCPDCGQVL